MHNRRNARVRALAIDSKRSFLIVCKEVISIVAIEKLQGGDLASKEENHEGAERGGAKNLIASASSWLHCASPC
jgi:hypothetical protein